MRAANFWDFAASPIMIGTIGCTPGLIVRPRSVSAARKYFVFSSSLSRSSVDALRSSSAFNEAATTGGAMVLENRYGRERCRKIDNLFASTRKPAARAAERFAQRSSDNVDPAHDAAIFVR